MTISSEEQQDIINHLLLGNNVIVDACAGSGKSTTILSAAQQLSNLEFIQVTYNSSLRTEIKEKIEVLKLNNIKVHTFHSLAVRYYLPTAYTDTGIRQILYNNIEPNEIIQKYQILVIDESQDMTFLYYQFIIKFTKDMGSPFLLLVLGDYMQGLYEFKGSDIRFLTKAVEIWNNHPFLKSNKFENCNLKMSYRITQPIADYINTSMLGEYRLLACKNGCKVTYISRCKTDTEKIVVNQVLTLLNTPGSDVKPSDIFILGASVKGSTSLIRGMENVLVENNIPCYVPMMETDKMDDRIIEGKVVFTTFHCVKGRQRKYVFVIGFDNSYMSFYGRDLPQKLCPNTLYVACTRATHGLFLMEGANYMDDRPLDFLRMGHHDMVKSDFVDFKGIPKTRFYKRTDELFISGEKKQKRRFTTPTELIKFVPESVLVEISPILDRIFVKSDEFVLNNIELEPVISTKRGLYEDVSDLNGIAIPSIYYDMINRYKITDNDIDLNSESSILLEMINSSMIDTKHNHPYLKKVFEQLPKKCETTADYLYLSNVYLAVQEKLYSKLRQIENNEYNWLSDDIIEQCKDRMNKVLGNEENKTSEVTIIKQSDDDAHYKIDALLDGKFEDDDTLYRFTARIDLITDISIWELKCTSDISLDHYLQVVIYAWLWKMTMGLEMGSRMFKIFNIKTGDIMILNSSEEDLDTIIIALLKGKFEKLQRTTDDKFITDCNNYLLSQF